MRSGGDQEHTAFPEGCPTAASGSFGGRILKISQLLMLTQLHFFFPPNCAGLRKHLNWHMPPVLTSVAQKKQLA